MTYYQRHRAERLAYGKKYQRIHAEKYKKYQKEYQWKKKHPELLLEENRQKEEKKLQKQEEERKHWLTRVLRRIEYIGNGYERDRVRQRLYDNQKRARDPNKRRAYYEKNRRKVIAQSKTYKWEHQSTAAQVRYVIWRISLAIRRGTNFVAFHNQLKELYDECEKESADHQSGAADQVRSGHDRRSG